MNQKKPLRQASERDREILRDVVQAFILSGEPVSSRSVARLEKHGLSAATIRNTMADLEDKGLLSQPHTSAGRVPTAAGYHYYIDSLMPNRVVPEKERLYIRDNLRQVISDVEELMAVVTHLLTEMSHQIGIVLAPVIGENTLKAVHFLKLSGSRALCVLESTGGLVEHRIVETLNPVSREELVRISNYLTDNFSGYSLREIRDRLLSQMARDRAQLDELLANAINLAQQALGSEDEPELLFEGTETVLTQPELSDILQVRLLLETFTDQAKLIRMLDQLIRGSGTRVIIGEDSDLTSELNFSLVATTYGIGEKTLGTLGIFGPSRMEYQRVLPLVDFLGRTVSEALERTG